MENINFIPVILGTDMNAYGVARSMHEKYGINSYCLGKRELYFIKDSKIVTPILDPDMENDETLIKNLYKLKNNNPNKHIIVIPCGDTYMEPLIYNKDKLDKDFIIPTINSDLMEQLMHKDRFYKYCDEIGIEYPHTVTCDYENYKDLEINFDYPIVIKPANSSDYWKCDFDAKKKAYTVNSEEEARLILNAIYSSDYRDKVIIQDFIPGNDDEMRMVCTYSGKDKKVKRMTCLHLLLEEHTPTGIGSSAAVIVEPNKELYNKVKFLLEKIGYVGFANIDFKFDERDNKFKIFDFNVRLPRSSYHITASGFNTGELVVNDYVNNKKLDCKLNQSEIVWACIPKSIIYKYTLNKELLNKAKRIINSDGIVNSTKYESDMNIKRRINLFKLDYYYKKNYKRYFDKRGFLTQQTTNNEQSNNSNHEQVVCTGSID